PADNIGFIAALESGGFAPTFATTRMYKGPAPKLGPQRLFGVTTLELG
ncbi:GNAT family N-acetyltransferase, partial [Mesorhizobium sp. M7D.F.Ca.US.004.01.2.1]